MRPDPPSFRPARIEDALEIVCLLDMASRGMLAWAWTRLCSQGQSLIEVGRERIRTVDESPLHFKDWIIAEIEGHVAGGMLGRVIPMPYRRGDAADLPDTYRPVLELETLAAGSWYLNAIAVYPEFQGQGLGSALIRQAEDIARSKMVTAMSLMVEEPNAQAIALYRRHGFSEVARRPYMPFPGSKDSGHWILLTKHLDLERV